MLSVGIQSTSIGEYHWFFGGYIAMNIHGNENILRYLHQFSETIGFIDIIPETIKTFFFGFFIGMIGCYKDFTASNGTESVGRAANSAVVAVSLVNLEIRNEERQFVKTDARVSIGSDGLMGDKVLIIYLGNNSTEIIKNDGVLASTNALEMEDIMQSVKKKRVQCWHHHNTTCRVYLQNEQWKRFIIQIYQR